MKHSVWISEVTAPPARSLMTGPSSASAGPLTPAGPRGACPGVVRPLTLCHGDVAVPRA